MFELRALQGNVALLDAGCFELGPGLVDVRRYQLIPWKMEKPEGPDAYDWDWERSHAGRVRRTRNRLGRYIRFGGRMAMSGDEFPHHAGSFRRNRLAAPGAKSCGDLEQLGAEMVQRVMPVVQRPPFGCFEPGRLSPRLTARRAGEKLP